MASARFVSAVLGVALLTVSRVVAASPVKFSSLHLAAMTLILVASVSRLAWGAPPQTIEGEAWAEGIAHVGRTHLPGETVIDDGAAFHYPGFGGTEEDIFDPPHVEKTFNQSFDVTLTNKAKTELFIEAVPSEFVPVGSPLVHAEASSEVSAPQGRVFDPVWGAEADIQLFYHFYIFGNETISTGPIEVPVAVEASVEWSRQGFHGLGFARVAISSGTFPVSSFSFLDNRLLDLQTTVSNHENVFFDVIWFRVDHLYSIWMRAGCTAGSGATNTVGPSTFFGACSATADPVFRIDVDLLRAHLQELGIDHPAPETLFEIRFNPDIEHAIATAVSEPPQPPAPPGPPGDADDDGVLDDADVCPATTIPEAVPARRLGVNRFGLVDDDMSFDTTTPEGGGPRRAYTLVDTAGCSCEQIIAQLGLGGGHTHFGCSISAMEDWVNLVSQ